MDTVLRLICVNVKLVGRLLMQERNVRFLTALIMIPSVYFVMLLNV